MPHVAASCAQFFESTLNGVAGGMTYGPDDRIWISEGQVPERLLRGISPAGGPDITFALHADVTGLYDPRGLTVGSDGRMWIAGGAGNVVAAVDLATGAIATVAVGGSPADVASGADGAIWVTLPGSDQIVRLVASSLTGISSAADATYFSTRLPGDPAGGAPTAIVRASDGALWFTEAGAARLGRISSGSLSYVAIAQPAARLTTSGNDLWFTLPASAQVGHLAIDGTGLYYGTASSGSQPWGIALGQDGGVWFTERSAARVGRMAPDTRAINETLITTSSAAPTFMLAVPDGTIWFANEANHLEHFKPNAAGTVGPLPPSVTLTAGSPVQSTPAGPVYSTTTVFSIGALDAGQCLDQVAYRITAAGSTPGAYGPAVAAPTSFTLTDGTWIVEYYGIGPGGQSVPRSARLVVDASRFLADTVKPVITVPSGVSVDATSVDGAPVTYIVTAWDATDGTVPAICAPPSGSIFPIGVTTVHCTASDLTGNFQTADFPVTVRPGPPRVSVPGDLIVRAAGASTPVTFQASALSPWGGPLAVRCDPPGLTQPSGSDFTALFPADVTTRVTCVSAADGLGQSATASFTVTPVTPPVLHLPAPVTVVATGPLTPVSYSVTATLAGGASVAATCVPPSGSGFGPGTTPVTCAASDRGVTTSGTFTVTVTVPAPTLSLPGDILRISGTPVAVSYSATASSVVDGPLSPVCLPASGSTFVIGTTVVTCTATDVRNVTTTGTFRVTVTPYASTATQFVIWGGDGVQVNQRAVFWGEHWWDGVRIPDKQKVKDFKGWAASVNGATWSTKPGDRNPPRTVPTYITVIITNSITRGGDDGRKGDDDRISGNIVGHAILRVDTPYRDEPGKSVSGIVVAVLP